jgi:hypothetical protein
VSETIASDAATALPSGGTGEGPRDASAVGVITQPTASKSELGKSEVAPAGSDASVEIDVEEIPARPAQTGFQAILQHANLHNLLQIESLSRTTGVFLVVSQGRRGYLHLSNGDLIHAECGTLSGENAASEILSWGDGEFKSCARPLAATTSIHSSIPHLLLRLARDSDEAAQAMSGARGPNNHALAPQSVHDASSRRPPPLPRAVNDEKPTEPHLPPASADGLHRSAAAPRSNRPPPLPPRVERDPASVAEVLISPSGELLQGRGIGPDEFSARVAYAARLADLIGRAIRSGTPRSLELKGKGTQTNVKWQPDGSLAATLELVQAPKGR